MVERKLTGVISNIQIEIPFQAFDALVDLMQGELEYCEVNISKSDVAIHPGVLQVFEKGVRDMLSEIDWADVLEHIDVDDTVELLFPEEIKKAQEAEEERTRILLEQYERDRAEQARLAAEQAAIKSAEMIARKAEFKTPETTNADEVRVVIKNRFLRKLVTLFGEKP